MTDEPVLLAIQVPITLPRGTVLDPAGVSFDNVIGRQHTVNLMGSPIGVGVIRVAEVCDVDGALFVNLGIEVGPDVSAEAMAYIRRLVPPG